MHGTTHEMMIIHAYRLSVRCHEPGFKYLLATTILVSIRVGHYLRLGEDEVNCPARYRPGSLENECFAPYI